jgi:general nucleoside transport system permease protein
MELFKRYQLKIEPRGIVTTRRQFLVRLISLMVAFIFGGVILVLVGANPVAAYAAMVKGAFGTVEMWRQGNFHNLSETLVKAIPIIITSLAVLVSFRMLFWNIGANGQFAFGAMAATYVALFSGNLIKDLPAWAYLPLMFIAGFLAGAIWGLVPALLRIIFNVNEIISSLLLNYVAVLFVENLYFGPWRDPKGMGFPGTAVFPEVARLPKLFGRVHFGLIFGLVLAIVLWVLLEKTKWGYEIKVIGQSPKAARYAGINLTKNIVLVMVLSGGISGIAGMGEVSGLVYRLQQGSLTGFGNTAIIVAWLSNLNVWVSIGLSLLMSALLVGGDQLQIIMQLPAAIALVLEGLLLFVILIGEFFIRFRINLIGRHSKKLVDNT